MVGSIGKRETKNSACLSAAGVFKLKTLPVDTERNRQMDCISNQIPDTTNIRQPIRPTANCNNCGTNRTLPGARPPPFKNSWTVHHWTLCVCPRNGCWLSGTSQSLLDEVKLTNAAIRERGRTPRVLAALSRTPQHEYRTARTIVSVRTADMRSGKPETRRKNEAIRAACSVTHSAFVVTLPRSGKGWG